MGVAGKAEFSFGELLVLIDVEGVGQMSSPLPTIAEAATLTGAEPRGTAPCLDLVGTCRFRADLYGPPRAELVVSPATVMLSLTKFSDAAAYTMMFDYVSGYLSDALTSTPRTDATHGYLEYAGQGVVVTLGFTRPSARLDARDTTIEISLRREDAPLATLRPLFGLAADAVITPPDDGNWRELDTRWPLHLECSRAHDIVKFRMSAPHHEGQTSTANLCEEWCWRWLDLGAGTMIGHHDRNRVSWELPALGHVSMIRGASANRRDVHELLVPASWFAPA
ncbi:MAG TPA: hypothetical protein VGM90_28775 [Kofleriaceae bacterium]|jgi:hypothetical protein